MEFSASMPFGRSLAILAKTYFGALTKRLGQHEIERYYSILIFLDKSDKACTQQLLCDQLKIDKVSMVRIVDYLIKKDFVHKLQNQDDRREYFIKLTPKAKQIIPELYLAINDVNKAAMKGLSKEEQKIFNQQLMLIQQNLDALPFEKIYINYKTSSKSKKE
jgi:DNA-binding MarR family transcriptional regulator